MRIGRPFKKSHKRVEPQHIAVFGQSGSGKTVLLSSFYGSMQEDEKLKNYPFRVNAVNGTPGAILHGNYLGMKRSNKVPPPNRFKVTNYAFSVPMKPGAKAESQDASLLLLWDDYPGDWFEDGVSGPVEEKRRDETLRSLINADLAFVLVDAAQLLENKGEEERYLKGLFTSLRNTLTNFANAMDAKGKLLKKGPRTWILALSKADLIPEMDVVEFRDLVIEKAYTDVEALKEQLRAMYESPEALSFGEEFLLLSSAKFKPGEIDVSKQIGVDLILPLAASLPMKNLQKWTERKLLNQKKFAEHTKKIADQFVINSNIIDRTTKALAGKNLKKLKPVIEIASFVAGTIPWAALAQEGTEKLDKNIQDNLEDNNFLSATIHLFAKNIKEAVEQRIYLSSDR